MNAIWMFTLRFVPGSSVNSGTEYNEDIYCLHYSVTLDLVRKVSARSRSLFAIAMYSIFLVVNF